MQLTWSSTPAISTLNGGTPTTGAPPAVLPYRDHLYVVYATSQSDSPSIWQMVYDGKMWKGNTKVSFANSAAPPQTLCGPALAELSGTLYMAWVTQASSKDSFGFINVASARVIIDGKPVSSDAWRLLSGKDIFGKSEAPPAYTQPLTMVVYPYKGVDSLWLFYNNAGTLCVAIGQPQQNDMIRWSACGLVDSWTSSINPKLSAGVTAAVVDYDTHSAPYAVFIGSSGSDLSYVSFNPDSKQFEGNAHIKPVKGTTSDIKAASAPTLFAFPRTPNTTSPMPAVLLYQGQHGASIDVAVFKDGLWYGNVELSSASKDHGTGGPINPTTNIGIGAAVYGAASQIVMVYPSASSPGGTQMWVAYGTFSES
jgi:hypothetical protein